jgi:hypothetical protein
MYKVVLRDFTLFLLSKCSDNSPPPPPPTVGVVGHTGQNINHPRDLSSIGRFIKVISSPKDLSSRGRIMQWTHRQRILFGDSLVGDTSS